MPFFPLMPFWLLMALLWLLSENLSWVPLASANSFGDTGRPIGRCLKAGFLPKGMALQVQWPDFKLLLPERFFMIRCLSGLARCLLLMVSRALTAINLLVKSFRGFEIPDFWSLWFWLSCLICLIEANMVRPRRLELPRAFAHNDPQRCASTNSAMAAWGGCYLSNCPKSCKWKR